MATRTTEQKAKHAKYMREYYSRPGKLKKKRLRDRTYASAHRVEARKKALDWYWNNRTKRIEYVKHRECLLKRKGIAFLGGKCIGCGETHPAMLQFHHRNPSEKEFSVTTKQMSCSKQYPWSRIEKELEKCDLVCANCHFLEHNTWRDEWLNEELK